MMYAPHWMQFKLLLKYQGNTITITFGTNFQDILTGYVHPVPHLEQHQCISWIV